MADEAMLCNPIGSPNTPSIRCTAKNEPRVKGEEIFVLGAAELLFDRDKIHRFLIMY